MNVRKRKLGFTLKHKLETNGTLEFTLNRNILI